MNYVTVWYVNDKLSDGMPGKSKYFRTEDEATAYYKDKVWQSIDSFKAVEIDSIVYFEPRPVMFCS